MKIPSEFNYAEICRGLLQRPGTVGLLTQIHESNGELRMLARTNRKLLSGLERSKRFRDAESFCEVFELGVRPTRLKALIYNRVPPNDEDQLTALTYWRLLNGIPKYNGNSNPPMLSEKDLETVDMLSPAPFEIFGLKGPGSQANAHLVFNYYFNNKHYPEWNYSILTAGMIKSFNKAAEDSTVAPLLAILCLVIDYRYVQMELRGFRKPGNLVLMYLLSRYGFVCGWYSSIEKIFGQRAEEGVKAFRESTEGWGSGRNDYYPCASFMLKTILDVYQDVFKQLEPVLDDRLSRTERVMRFISGHEGTVPKRAIVEAHSDICLRSMERLLSNLTEEGRIDKVVNGRDVQFRFLRDTPDPEKVKNRKPE